jgi:DNA-binding NarL/FixJ family response regulator
MSEHVSSKFLRRRVLIADNQPLFRDGVRNWLQQQPDLECCGEADEAAALHQAVGALRPDLVLLDLRLKGEDGVETIKSLRTAFPAVPLLVLSQDEETIFGDRVLRAGARGYLMKDRPGTELMEAIRQVLAGEIYASKPLADIMLRKLWQGETSGDPTSRLSDREMQVFRLLGTGLGTRQIAHRLRLGIKTVETYREHLKRKLGLKSAPALVHAASTWMAGR